MEWTPADHKLKERNGPFSRKIFRGEFAVTVEMVPPRGGNLASFERKVRGLADLAASGLVDGINLVDGSLSEPLIYPDDFIAAARDALGWTCRSGDPVEWIAHFTSRQQNTLALERRLLGHHLQRIHNLLFTSGDPLTTPPGYPPTTAIFDADSTTLIGYAQKLLNAGFDLAGRTLDCSPTHRPHFTIGSGVEPALEALQQLEPLRN